MEKHRNGRNTKLGTTFNELPSQGFNLLLSHLKEREHKGVSICYVRRHEDVESQVYLN